MRRCSVLALLTILIPFSILSAEVVTVGDGGPPLEVTVLESSPDRTVIAYDIGSFSREDVAIGGDTYAAVALGRESRLLEKGAPALPNVARSIIIPDDARMSVSVLQSHYVDIPGIRVAPSKGNLTRDVNPALVPYEFGQVYETDAWYPADLVEMRDPYIMRDHRGMVVTLNPVQYNPSTQTLRVYDRVVLEVAAVGPGTKNVLTVRPPGGVDAEFAKIYRRHFLNAHEYEGHRYPSTDEIGGMLIIAYDDFVSSVAPLVEWKRQMGVPCEVVSVTAAGGTPSNIKSYIESYYAANDLAFVLLVGDASQVPTFSAAGGASDPSYSLLAGTDSYPEILVGRFSAETTTHVETQVQKAVEYEKQPAAGGDWYHKGTGIASDEGPGDDGEYDYQHQNNIRADLLGFTYTEVDQIYDPGANASMVSDALNDGRSIVNYTGHGATMGWSTSGFTNSYVNGLTNDDMLPVVFAVACLNGNFNGYTCFAETWLRATHGSEPSGAVGAYMSSISQSWDPPMDAQDEFTDLLVAGAKRTFGGLCYNACGHMMDEYGSGGESEFLTWHVFGDPSLRVRTDTPAALAVTHDPTVTPSATTFDVNVAGVEDALCALYYGGTLYGSALTDAGGDATIAIDPALPEDVDVSLTVTSFNAIPYLGTVHVQQAYVPVVDVTPGLVELTLEPGGAGLDTLRISNTGEPLSVLSYAVEIVDQGSVRSMTGSTVTSLQSSYDPGTTVDLTLYLYNGSIDDEWIISTAIDFPSGVMVNASTDFMVSGRTALAWNGVTGDGAYTSWEYESYYDSIYPGETAVATVNVTFDAGLTGDQGLYFTITGDEWGAPPHSVSGTVVLDGPPSGPSVTLTAPNGGEAWGIGEARDITWDWTGTFAEVSLSYSVDNGGAWTQLTGSTPNDGTYGWVVDAPVSDSCLIKVVSLTSPASEDVSDGPFEIFQPCVWLTAGPMDGTVASGDTEDVILTLDATGLAEGDYFADVVVTTNGGAPVTVPVTLSVRTTGVDDTIPRALTLHGNFPNPFNPTTRIAFALPEAGDVEVAIYTVGGRLVKTLGGAFGPGLGSLLWDGRDSSGAPVASGVYLYRVRAGRETRDGRMVLLK